VGLSYNGGYGKGRPQRHVLAILDVEPGFVLSSITNELAVSLGTGGWIGATCCLALLLRPLAKEAQSLLVKFQLLEELPNACPAGFHPVAAIWAVR
jgi:hypothetical protein